MKPYSIDPSLLSLEEFRELTAGKSMLPARPFPLSDFPGIPFEYTELLPRLPSGVVVHIHDIFSPYDYPEEWLNKTFRLWGEQYLVEAMLANGSDWRILAALNWLSKDSEQFGSLCPFFYEGRMPGSMWIQKR